MDPPEHPLRGELSSCHPRSAGEGSATDSQPVRMLFCVYRNFLENGVAIRLRPPPPVPRSLTRIEHQPRHVERAALLCPRDFVCSEPIRTPVAQLPQRHTAADAAAEI